SAPERRIAIERQRYHPALEQVLDELAVQSVRIRVVLEDLAIDQTVDDERAVVTKVAVRGRTIERAVSVEIEVAAGSDLARRDAEDIGDDGGIRRIRRVDGVIVVAQASRGAVRRRVRIAAPVESARRLVGLAA